MEDRYEIKSRIGQGGFGSVYRAFDKRMNREVAIKRINASNEDGMLEEASRQLSKEAGALASMQHPNIITIYDVGNDEDGPYVVMELLSGSALDDLVDKAPLTWDDFRELAMQSQEALIGAQELDLVHRDIKPANVMLSWLPSGKFQVKLLDFGLAKLTQRPSLQTLNQADSIFGSIFFMSPEQFERAPIDRRTDMYAMGCVYYYALTGSHPFDGATAVEVMSAHLHHDFVPLDEVRPDLPKWVCDWVMWHMNRYPDDRPGSARDALQVFVQNDKYPPIEAPPAPPQTTNRPKLLIPGAEPLVPGTTAPEHKPEPSGRVSLITKTAPQPLIPPTGKPSVHSSRQTEIEQAQKPDSKDTSTAEQSVAPESDASEANGSDSGDAEQPKTIGETQQPDKPAADTEASKATDAPAPDPTPRKSNLPQKKPTVAPPTGGVRATTATSSTAASTTPPKGPTLIKRPSLSTPPKGTSPVPATGPQPAVPPPSTGPQPVIATPAVSKTASQPVNAPQSPSSTGTQPSATEASPPAAPKQSISNSAKITIIAIASILVLLVGWFVLQKVGQSKVRGKYNELMTLAAHPETSSVPINKAMLDVMLQTAASTGSNSERETVYRALLLASPTDGTNIDAEIVRFVTQQEMMDNVREKLLSEVLRRRGNPQIVAPLLEFASKSDRDGAVIASLQAIRNLVDASHMDALLQTIQFASHVEIRRAAEEAIVEIINQSPDRQKYASKLNGIFRSSVNDDARHAALRLAGRVGDSSSLELAREILREGSQRDQTAALSALAGWRNEEAFPILINFINSTDEAQLANRAFEAGLRYASSLDGDETSSALRRDVWTQLSMNARTPEEQDRLIRMLATNSRDEWVIALLQRFTANNYEARVRTVAERAIDTIRLRREQD